MSKQIWNANYVSFMPLNTIGSWTLILTLANWSFSQISQKYLSFSRHSLGMSFN